MEDFKNEPFTDFSNPTEQAKMQTALKAMQGRLGQTYSIIIDGKKHETGNLIRSIDPSNRETTVASVHAADQALAKQAVEVAAQRFVSWSKVPAAERSQYLFEAARIIRERKPEFSAAMVFEVGKSWVEADADTAEAIDFLEFYGRENLRYNEKQPLTAVSGEDNELCYIPLGVCAVIPPWNFPFAIMAGMTTAACVAGNTVVLKPSSDAPLLAAMLMEVLDEVGLPAGVVNFLPGRGGEVGDTLVNHPKTRLIAFTGSKEVGLRINELAAKTTPGQIWIKRVIAEMGGKDSILVDHETDIKEAVSGVVASAFGFQGQKCSACSRAIVVDEVYDEFVKLLKDKVAELKVGPPTDPSFQVGAVINEAAYDKTLQYIAIGQKEGTKLCGGNAVRQGEGFYIEPTVFTDVDPQARLAQEEIFGPVLAVIRARDFDHGLEIANNTEYGLTGAVYTRNETKIEKARNEFHVGNFYINRKCTGALVGGHPFGGFNMSGTDSKAGGRDYLLLFSQAKLISRRRD